MMSQLDDASCNLWSSDLWNNNNDSMQNGAWFPEYQVTNVDMLDRLHFSVSKESTNISNVQTNQHTLSWPPIGASSHEVDVNSIWSTPTLYPSNSDSPSLSGPRLPWPISPNYDIETPKLWEPKVSDAISVSEIGLHSTWQHKDEIDHIVTSNVIKPTMPIATDIPSNSCTVSIIATIKQENDSSFPDKAPETCRNDSPATDAFPADDLYSKLINSNDGWGCRFIDQTTPWDTAESTKISEVVRSDVVTPTPGAPNSTKSLQFATESNVWTSEPPTGTKIWELHYENCSVTRGMAWTGATASLSSHSPLIQSPMSLGTVDYAAVKNGQRIPLASTVSVNSMDTTNKLWSGSNCDFGIGRPLLGNAHSISSINQSEESLICSIDSFTDSNGNCASWDEFTNSNSTIPWSSGMPTSAPLGSSVFSNCDEFRRQSTVQTSGSQVPTAYSLSGPYRTDLIKCMMNQGFKKDVQASLIDCNMEPDRSQVEFRDRYQQPYNASAGGFQLPSPSSSWMPNVSQGTNQIQPGNINCLPGSILSSSNATRNKFVAVPSTATSHNRLPHCNTQLIRQQQQQQQPLTQQVRPTLNMPLPNSVNAVIGSAQVAIAASGNSLLGQPPPPLLSGVLPNNGLSNGPTVSASHNRNFNNTNGSRFSSSFASAPKRTERQINIIAAIQDLNKKLQSIRQQVVMYRSNPTMCSQPQYADVTSELHGQMQQIEAQLKAKHVQLSMAYAQDNATLNREQSFVTISNGHNNSHLNSGGNSVTGISSQNRPSQERLVQQLLEMRIRSSASTNGDANDGEFPVIGTWNPLPKNNFDGDTGGTRSLTVMRPANAKSQCSPNWNGGWQPHTARVIQNTNTPNWISSGNASRQIDNVSSQSGIRSSPLTNSSDQQFTSHGQWLLLHPPNSSGFGPNLAGLHSVLSHYGMTHFHVLNPAGYIMVRFQSVECVIQLMRVLGDRLSWEPVDDPDLVIQLLQRNPRSENSYNQCSLSGESKVSDMTNGTPWFSADSTSPGVVSLYGPKKQNSHSARLGVMVSGMQ